MSAEVLRRAAALMRERAEPATPGPWTCFGDHLVWASDKGPAANDPILAMMGEAHQDSAQHIASWHPEVALAVADLLVMHADALDETNANLGGSGSGEADWPEVQPNPFFLAVARAYLGEQP